jgi:hypothetical protein
MKMLVPELSPATVFWKTTGNWISANLPDCFMNVNKINNAYHLEMKIFNHHDHGHGCLQIHAHGSRINLCMCE